MEYDIVYPLKEAEPNWDLIYSLRSLEKYGGDYGEVFIAGYMPSYLKNVHHIPVNQNADKWRNSRMNRITACEWPEVSDNFILFNDDFILTAPVEDWDELTNRYIGTLEEHGKTLADEGKLSSRWVNGFAFNMELLQSMGVDEPLDYEFHAPMLFNKQKTLELFERDEVKPYLDQSNPLIFQRSLYGNLYPRETKGRKIRDIKLRSDSFDIDDLHENGCFSVPDGMIGRPSAAPRLNFFLQLEFPHKSRYEV